MQVLLFFFSAVWTATTTVLITRHGCYQFGSFMRFPSALYIVCLCSVDCMYEATAQLHHSFEARVIAAGESVDIPFTFYPREARRYQELVTFEINGLSKQTVEFIGTGCDLKVRCMMGWSGSDLEGWGSVG